MSDTQSFQPFIVSVRSDLSANPTVASTPYYILPSDVYEVSPQQTGTNPVVSYNYNLNAKNVGSNWASQVMDAAGGLPILIFIHGYANSSTDAASKLMAFGPTLFSQGLFVIAFDWPTTSSNQTSYPTDHTDAVASGPLLIPQCISVLTGAGIQWPQINILTHSMGGYVLQNAFNATQPPNQPLVNQVLMAEADVLACFFSTDTPCSTGSALGCFMSNLKHLTVYWSDQDQALKGAGSKLAPSTDQVFTGPCTKNTPSGQTYTYPATTRLGFVGLDSATLSSSYSAQVDNVEYDGYYQTCYVTGVSGRLTESDSHVWPLIGTTGNYCPQPGDPYFVADVASVLNGQPSPVRSSTPSGNNWTFKIPTSGVPYCPNKRQ